MKRRSAPLYGPCGSGKTLRCFALIAMQLFTDIVPKTCANFRALCTGENGESASSEFKLHYEGSLIHRVVPNGWIQGGGMSCISTTLSAVVWLVVARRHRRTVSRARYILVKIVYHCPRGSDGLYCFVGVFFPVTTITHEPLDSA